MAYKFQIGAAKLSGSVEQTNGADIKAQTSFSIGNATVNEAQLEILDGATVTTTQINLLDSYAAAVADVASHNMVFHDGTKFKQESLEDYATAIAGDALAATSGQLAVQVDDSSIETDSDALRVKAAGITNAMLAGSIANAKLANSTISGKALGTSLDALAVDDSSIEYSAGSAFNGSAASTIQVKAAGITNAMLAGSIEAAKLAGSIPADKLNLGDGVEDNGGNLQINLDGASSGLALAGDGLSLASSIPGNRTFSANVIVSGDLTVNGTNTILNTTTLEVEDNNIVIHSGSAPADGAGITIGTDGTPVTLQMSDSAANLQSSVPLKASSFIGALVGNADSATVGTTITVANEATNTTCSILFSTAASGDLGAKSNSDLTFNSSNGQLAADSFVGDGSALTGVVITDQVDTLTNTTNVLASKRTIFMNAQGGPCSVQLPDADGRTGVIYKIKRLDTSANACTIELDEATNKLEFITNGNVLLETQGAAVSCVSDGTDWFIM